MQVCLILLDPVVVSSEVGKQAIDCNSMCQDTDLSSQHMCMGNINISLINNIPSTMEGPTLFSKSI